MACFPRWFRRQKASFVLIENENNPETLFQSEENSVRIGRYVRYEETSFAVTNKKTSSQSQNQRTQNSSEETVAELSRSISDKNNHINKSNGAISNNGSQTQKNNLIKIYHNHKNDNKSGGINRAHVLSNFKPIREDHLTILLKEKMHLKANLSDNAGDDKDNIESDDDDYINKEYASQNYVSDKQETKNYCNNYQQNKLNEDNDIKKLASIENDEHRRRSRNTDVTFFIGPRDSDVDSLQDAESRKSTINSYRSEIESHARQIKRKNSCSSLVQETRILPPISSLHSINTTSLSSNGPKNVSDNLPKFPKTSRYSRNLDKKVCKNRCLQNMSMDTTNIPPPPPPSTDQLTTSSSSTPRPSQMQSRHDAYNSQNENKNRNSSPNDNDIFSSPKLHRVEGGLFFLRPTLSEKENPKIEYIEKDKTTRNLIRTAIERNDFLNNYMDYERREMVIDAMERASYNENSFIIHENEEGDEIFVSEKGYFDVIKSGEVVGTLGPGTVFGELAILYNAKRFASIKAKTQVQVWKIGREKFRNIMMISGSREREENLNFLRSAPFLQELAENVLERVVDLLQRKFYETNTCIVREGEVGDEFFIIRGGTVTIKKKDEYGAERVVDRRKRGDYFGEQALLNADRRQASVYADAPGTECLKLDREAFTSYLGTIPQLRMKPVERNVEEQAFRLKSQFDDKYANIELSDLKHIASLGAGAFGRVDLVSYKTETYALKIMKKVDIVKQDQVEHVYSEKHVMIKCRSSPFIVELYKTFRNDKYVFFLMEACLGGDVWTLMSQRGFFDEKTARFVAACVVEALGYLHSQNIIYRDLKPENLLLTCDGYCKLVDFGFAKFVPPHHKTNTFAGTPEYVAPEIILDRGHDRSVDYWALGILIFELLVGKTPFRGQNQIKIYQQILSGIDVIQMPAKIPKLAQNLIKNLCKQLPAERLGYQRKGILDIKRHSWFDHLDWDKLKTKELISPIKRPVSSNIDVQYFLSCDIEDEYDYEPPDENSGWDADF